MAIPAIIGGIGSLIQGNRANQQARQGMDFAKQQFGFQQQQANQLNQLYQQTAPQYHTLLNALSQNAGLGNQTPEQQSAAEVLGQGATPADVARFRALQGQLAQGGQEAMNAAQYGMGTRGLYGSSLAASQGAAIQSNLAQAGAQLRSQLMNEAQQNYSNRLQQYLGALGPGLAAAGEAAGIAGQAGQQGLQYGQQAFGQGQVFGSQLSGALQNYLQYQAGQNYLNQRPLSNFDFGNSLAGNVQMGNQAYNNFAGAGLGQTQDLGGGYSMTLPNP